MTGAPGFDRLRRRDGAGPDPRRVSAPRDPLGTRALYSAVETQRPAFGAVSVACSSCGGTSVLGASRALRLAVPSVHLPLLRREHPSWMRCPGCGRRTWVRVSVRL